MNKKNQMRKKCPECGKVLNSYNPNPYCYACITNATIRDDRILEENEGEIVQLKARLRTLKNPKKLEGEIRNIENKIKKCEKYNTHPYCHTRIVNATIRGDRILEENEGEIVQLKARLRTLKNPKKLEGEIRNIEKEMKRCEKAMLRIKEIRSGK